MNKKIFNDFCKEFKGIIGSYLNDDAWEVTSRWFEDGRGSITIEYDINEIDWDEVDPDWENECDNDLCNLCSEWGGSWDWNGTEIAWGFNL